MVRPDKHVLAHSARAVVVIFGAGAVRLRLLFGCVQGQLVFYDYGMMAQLKPNVLEGFREFCFALFDGGPMISDIELSRNARKLVAAVEKMGVLAKGADRLAVEKLARFFMRSFKDVQLGKKTGNIRDPG